MQYLKMEPAHPATRAGEPDFPGTRFLVEEILRQTPPNGFDPVTVRARYRVLESLDRQQKQTAVLRETPDRDLVSDVDNWLALEDEDARTLKAATALSRWSKISHELDLFLNVEIPGMATEIPGARQNGAQPHA